MIRWKNYLSIIIICCFNFIAAFADQPLIPSYTSSPDILKGEFEIPVLNENGYLEFVVRHDVRLLKLDTLEIDEDLWAEEKLRIIAETAILGPDNNELVRGLRSAFPSGTVIDEVRVEKNKGGFYISLPNQYLLDLTAEKAQQLSDLFLMISYYTPQIRHHVLMVYDDRDGKYHTLNDFLPDLGPVPPKPFERDTLPTYSKATGQPPASGQGQPAGELTGRSIFVNPGHGWYYNDDPLYRWATQRGNTNNIIEDLSNVEAVMTYLIPYLWNAGANVYTCRERDMNPLSVIVEDNGTGYSETGTWEPISSADGHGGTYRRAITDATETATATFTPDIPESGYYHVYIWYAGYSSNANDATISINHTGGNTVITRNMEVDGYTYKNMGVYFFNQGSNPTTGSVVISNISTENSNYVIADAVRFGGGTGNETPFGEPYPSYWPRYEEAGPYHANYMGCPSATCSPGTVTAMPRYAAWENEGWEDPVYISWHTNAPNPGTGTSSFAYSSGGWDGAFDGVPGGLELRNFIHDEIINDVRAGYDPSWYDRGKHTANFGEINPNNNSEMPGALFEMAFHDTPADALDLQNPVFRQIVARAVYQGIVKYYADRDGQTVFYLLPEPPTNLYITNDVTGNIVLNWDIPPSNTGDDLLGDPATGYRVYRSNDGFGFDNGIAISGQSNTTYTDTSVNLGTTYYYRVTATNSGGESFPTETLAARASLVTSDILIVAGFDRMDHNLIVVTDDPYSTNDLHRGYVDMMNSYRYIIPYASAIDTYGSSFDSCSNESVRDSQIDLNDYTIVIWYVGEESVTDETLDATEQSLLESYLDGGGNLFVSGAEIAWDLDYLDHGRSFYNNYLMTDYIGDDADTYDVVPSSGSIFDGNTSFSFDDNSFGEYDTNYPDQLDVLSGSTVCLTYSGGNGGNAGIQHDGLIYKIVNFGFPFETITSSTARTEIMSDILDFFGSSSGSPCDNAIDITSLPYSNSNDTTAEQAYFNWYSCAPSVNEAGPEIIYRLVLDEPGDLTVTVTDDSGVDIDPHLLSECSVSACLARDDISFTLFVEPGTYYISCDTYTDGGGTQYPGAYTLDVDFIGWDTTPPSEVENLVWNLSGQWEWDEVLLDQQGGPEVMGLYEVYRSTVASSLGSLIAATSFTYLVDSDIPGVDVCWYYQIQGIDAEGNSENPTNDIIVDNIDASFVGSWNTGTTAPGHYGDDYRHIATGGTGSNTATWTFIPEQGGKYDIQVYYPEGTNRSSEARFAVTDEFGTIVYLVDQQSNGGNWNSLGEYWFKAGNTYPIVLDDAEPTGFVVIADAVRWIRVP